MKFIRWRNIMLLFLSLLLFVTAPAALNYTGFCFAEKRWLSSDEMIRAVIEYSPQDMVRVDSEEGRQSYTRAEIDTADAFVARNSECCGFSPAWRNEYSFLERITGSFGGYVIIHNATKLYVDNNGEIKEAPYSLEGWAMTNCGESNN